MVKLTKKLLKKGVSYRTPKSKSVVRSVRGAFGNYSPLGESFGAKKPKVMMPRRRRRKSRKSKR